MTAVVAQETAMTVDPIRADIKAGVRVTVEFRGTTYTGTVRNAHRRGGHFRWEGGTMTNLELGELDGVSIVTDQPVPTPAGRTVDSVYIRPADNFDRIQVINPATDGSRFCLDCGATFTTTAGLDAHQDETGHEKDQSTEVTITRT